MDKSLKSTFRNAGETIIPPDKWDDCGFADGFIVIKKDFALTAMYHAADVFSVVVESEEEKDD